MLDSIYEAICDYICVKSTSTSTASLSKKEHQEHKIISLLKKHFWDVFETTVFIIQSESDQYHLLKLRVDYILSEIQLYITCNKFGGNNNDTIVQIKRIIIIMCVVIIPFLENNKSLISLIADDILTDTDSDDTISCSKKLWTYFINDKKMTFIRSTGQNRDATVLDRDLLYPLLLNLLPSLITLCDRLEKTMDISNETCVDKGTISIENKISYTKVFDTLFVASSDHYRISNVRANVLSEFLMAMVGCCDFFNKNHWEGLPLLIYSSLRSCRYLDKLESPSASSCLSPSIPMYPFDYLTSFRQCLKLLTKFSSLNEVSKSTNRNTDGDPFVNHSSILDSWFLLVFELYYRAPSSKILHGMESELHTYFLNGPPYILDRLLNYVKNHGNKLQSHHIPLSAVIRLLLCLFRCFNKGVLKMLSNSFSVKHFTSSKSAPTEQIVDTLVDFICSDSISVTNDDSFSKHEPLLQQENVIEMMCLLCYKAHGKFNISKTHFYVDTREKLSQSSVISDILDSFNIYGSKIYSSIVCKYPPKDLENDILRGYFESWVEVSRFIFRRDEECSCDHLLVAITGLICLFWEVSASREHIMQSIIEDISTTKMDDRRIYYVILCALILNRSKNLTDDDPAPEDVDVFVIQPLYKLLFDTTTNNDLIRSSALIPLLQKILPYPRARAHILQFCKTILFPFSFSDEDNNKISHTMFPTYNLSAIKNEVVEILCFIFIIPSSGDEKNLDVFAMEALKLVCNILTGSVANHSAKLIKFLHQKLIYHGSSSQLNINAAMYLLKHSLAGLFNFFALVDWIGINNDDLIQTPEACLQLFLRLTESLHMLPERCLQLQQHFLGLVQLALSLLRSNRDVFQSCQKFIMIFKALEECNEINIVTAGKYISHIYDQISDPEHAKIISLSLVCLVALIRSLFHSSNSVTWKKITFDVTECKDIQQILLSLESQERCASHFTLNHSCFKRSANPNLSRKDHDSWNRLQSLLSNRILSYFLYPCDNYFIGSVSSVGPNEACKWIGEDESKINWLSMVSFLIIKQGSPIQHEDERIEIQKQQSDEILFRAALYFQMASNVILLFKAHNIKSKSYQIQRIIMKYLLPAIIHYSDTLLQMFNCKSIENDVPVVVLIHTMSEFYCSFFDTIREYNIACITSQVNNISKQSKQSQIIDLNDDKVNLTKLKLLTTLSTALHFILKLSTLDYNKISLCLTDRRNCAYDGEKTFEKWLKFIHYLTNEIHQININDDPITSSNISKLRIRCIAQYIAFFTNNWIEVLPRGSIDVPTIVKLLDDACLSLWRLICENELKYETMFKSVLLLSTSTIPLLSRNIQTLNWSVKSKQYFGQIAKDDALLHKAFRHCIFLLESWYEETKNEINVDVLDAVNSILKLSKNNNICCLKLYKGDVWTWALECVMVAYERNISEFNRSLKEEVIYSNDHAIQEGKRLSSILMHLHLLFRKMNDKEGDGEYVTVFGAELLSPSLKVRLCSCLHKLASVIKLASNRLIRSISFDKESNTLLSQQFCYDYDLSILSALHYSDDSVNLLQATRAWYEVETRRDTCINTEVENRNVLSEGNPILSRLPSTIFRLENCYSCLEHLLSVATDSQKSKRGFIRKKNIRNVKQSLGIEKDDALIALLKKILGTLQVEPASKLAAKKIHDAKVKSRKRKSRNILRSQNEVVDEWLTLDKDLEEEGTYDDDFADLDDFLVDG